MKIKIELNTEVTLDEITYKLQQELSTKELVEFVIQIGDKLTDADNYYKGLLKEMKKIGI